MSFFAELKRRNVVRVGIAYAVAAWLLIQVTDIVFPRIGLPDSAVTLVIALLGIGFVPALIFAWAFEMTPEGIKREHEVDRSESITPKTGKKLDRLIIAALALVVGWFLFDEFYLEPRATSKQAANPAPVSAAATVEGNTANGMDSAASAGQRSVAVLPFRAMSSGEDDEYFADGLTEEILNSLTALPELLVTARTSSFHFKDKDLPIPEIARILGVDHVVEGSVRRSGDTARITAQLIRAEDGFHLWSDTYDRTLEDVFAVQEDIAGNVATTLEVVLDEDQRRRMSAAGIGNVDAFIAYQKAMDLFGQAHTENVPISGLLEANRWFDQALAIVPDIPDALYLSTDMYGHILFNHAVGAEPVSDATLAEAQAAIDDRLNAAIRAAHSPAQRAIFEVERTVLSDDWSGIRSQIERAFVPGDCSRTNWMPNVAAPYGWAPQVAEHLQNAVRCDPVSGYRVAMLALFETWNGNPGLAVEIADQHLREGSGHPWVSDMRLLALLASGEFGNHPELLGPAPEGSWFEVPPRIFVQARAGQVAEARQELERWLQDNEVDDVAGVMLEAALGDRAAANAHAAQIDQRTGGTLVLAETVKGCLCGAPFELEATPVFKARIEEAGLPWPPPSPIQYPAKDW